MKPTIALFIYDPKCSVQSGNGIIRALQAHYNFKIFGKNELEKVFFDDVDMIAVPGGLGDASSYETAFRYNAEPVRDFVAKGGRYLGICMGAYWAGSHYLNILQDVDAEQYITRPKTDTHRPHAKNLDICWNGRTQKMFFYDGCALVGDQTRFETVATYANGDAMAIRQNNIGLIGCHPESEQFWYDSYSWMRGRYHGGQHHELLLDFVDQMFVTK
jgi:phosphoribosylformylglycinamidine (FGAM) synthase-like amidotransferase family enzyme